jgi:hypothetical protein
MEKSLFIFWKKVESKADALKILAFCPTLFFIIGIVDLILGWVTKSHLRYEGAYSIIYAGLLIFAKLPNVMFICFLWSLLSCILAIDHYYEVLTLLTALIMFRAMQSVDALNEPDVPEVSETSEE